MPLVIRDDTKDVLKDVSVWRYLQADAVFYTLLTASLRFTQVKEFQDHWEGLISPASRRNQINIDEEIAAESGTPIPPQAFGHFENFNKFMHYVSSWTFNTPDKMLMWQAFTSGNDGVALEVDLSNIQEHLTDKVDSGEIGRISYVDLESVPAQSLHWREELFRKRPAFEHENEVRIVIDNMFSRPPGQIFYHDFPAYHYETIDLSCIKSIQVHPYSAKELQESLINLMAQLGLNIQVSRSVVAEFPNY